MTTSFQTGFLYVQPDKEASAVKWLWSQTSYHLRLKFKIRVRITFGNRQILHLRKLSSYPTEGRLSTKVYIRGFPPAVEVEKVAK